MEKNKEPQLTPQVEAALQQFAKEGINFTPEMVRNTITEMFWHPIGDLLTHNWSALNLVLTDSAGRLFPFFRVGNPMFGSVGMKEPNLDFTKIWEQKNMKLSLNLIHGFLSLATHGMNPYVKQELKPYDVDDLLSILLAKHLAQHDDSWRSKKWKVPKQLRFSKKIRKRTQKLLDEFRGIERRRRREEKMVDQSSTICG